MPVFRAGTLDGQADYINTDDTDRWYGPPADGHYRLVLHRLIGRWFVGRVYADCRTYVPPPRGWPTLKELASSDAALWCEANGIDIPDVLIAKLHERTASPADAGRSSREVEPAGRNTSSPQWMPETGRHREIPLESNRTGSPAIRDRQGSMECQGRHPQPKHADRTQGSRADPRQPRSKGMPPGNRHLSEQCAAR